MVLTICYDDICHSAFGMESLDPQLNQILLARDGDVELAAKVHGNHEGT